MHKERVQDIRDIMASLIGANRTYMLNWQCPSDGITFATNLDEFHKCGNTACFAGTLALSPMFQREGGRVGNRGRPEFFPTSGVMSVQKYLDISFELAYKLVQGDTDTDGKFSHFYSKNWADVTAEDVVEKLDMILNGELKMTKKKSTLKDIAKFSRKQLRKLPKWAKKSLHFEGGKRDEYVIHPNEEDQ